MMIATLAMLSVVGSAQYARAQQTGTNQNAKELSGGTILSTVKGVVISAEDGMPVIGASIMVGGGQAQAITDENGCFQLSNVPANSKLKISYIGLVTAFATPSANMKVRCNQTVSTLMMWWLLVCSTVKKKVLRVRQ